MARQAVPICRRSRREWSGHIGRESAHARDAHFVRLTPLVRRTAGPAVPTSPLKDVRPEEPARTSAPEARRTVAHCGSRGLEFGSGTSPGRGERNPREPSRRNLCRPAGAQQIQPITHGSRRGLLSAAALRLPDAIPASASHPRVRSPLRRDGTSGEDTGSTVPMCCRLVAGSSIQRLEAARSASDGSRGIPSPLRDNRSSGGDAGSTLPRCSRLVVGSSVQGLETARSASVGPRGIPGPLRDNRSSGEDVGSTLAGASRTSTPSQSPQSDPPSNLAICRLWRLGGVPVFVRCQWWRILLARALPADLR